MAVVELRGVRKVYPNGVEAVSETSLTVGTGEFFAVVGPSGSGKSTLLRLIAGLERPTTGSVWIGGRDVTGLAPRDRDVAMVFQEPALYPYLSVFDNLGFGLRARGVARSEVRARVEPVAASLGLAGVLGRRPQTLSGGQRQRVALGRAVVRRPAVFLLDEPLSRLDAPLRASVRADLIDLHRGLNATILYVTHDQGEALAMADRVAVLEAGRVVQVGRPEAVYAEPGSRFVAGFVGPPAMNFLPCEVVNDGGGLRLVPTGLGAGRESSFALGPTCGVSQSLKGQAGRRVLLGVRPEDVGLVEPGDETEAAPVQGRWTWLPAVAEVRRTEFLGHETVVTVALGPHAVSARAAQPGFRSAAGDRLRLGLDLSRACWFDPDTGLRLSPAPGAPVGPAAGGLPRG